MHTMGGMGIYHGGYALTIMKQCCTHGGIDNALLCTHGGIHRECIVYSNTCLAALVNALLNAGAATLTITFMNARPESQGISAL
jgi:hypothetical protein